MPLNRRFFLSILLSAHLCGLAFGQPNSYHFWFNGRPIEPPIDCLHDGPPGPGDVARLEDSLWVVLDEPGDYRLRVDPKNINRILRQLPGGRLQLYAASQSWGFRGKAEPDGLKGLSAEQASQLRGLSVHDWSPAVAAELKRLKPFAACWNIQGLADFQAGKFPSLPQGVRYLNVTEGHSPCFENLDNLGRFSSLTYFRGRWMTPSRVSGRLFAPHRGLRFLSCNRLTDGQSLGGLVQLVELNSRDGVLANLQFLSGLPDLTRLSLPRCQLTDAAGLGNHAHLQEALLSYNPIQQLPSAPTPGLQRLELLGSSLQEEQLSLFRDGHPDTKVVSSHGDSLQAALSGCDHLRIRTGGTCHRRPEEEKTLIELRDPPEVARVSAFLKVVEPKEPFECMCCGEPTLEFFQGEKLVHSVGFHHGQGLRWHGWGSDCRLDPSAATLLVGWMAEHGLAGPQAQLEAGLARRKQREAILERATTGFPASLKCALTGEGDFVAELERSFPEPERQARALIQVLGAMDGGWNNLEELTQLLRTFPVATVGQQLELALNDSNLVLRRGAARVWRTLPLKGWRPAQPGVACQAALTVLEQSRNAQVREQAVKALSHWKGALTPDLVQAHLEYALADPEDDVRQAALEKVGEWRLMPLYPLAEGFVSGHPCSPRAELPDEDSQVVYHQPLLQDWEVAALALGRAAHQSSRGVIEARKPGLARDLALALLGRPDLLRKAHFQEDFASLAVEAVIRDRGRHGLKWAIECRQSAAALLEMMRQQKFPGIERVHSPQELPRWYRP